ncbi:putative gustatory receptor 98a [Musca autumnalis]|uniref:putative gustatory receptor 98a n=1 Tax=Musca autumnalis TaxID=221902 RepID=UPI003CF7DA7C
MAKFERHNPFLNALLKEISLQLYHQKIAFTAGGFVDVNLKLFGKAWVHKLPRLLPCFISEPSRTNIATRICGIQKR